MPDGEIPDLSVERQVDRPARAGSHRPDLAADPRTTARRDADPTGPGGRGRSHPGVRVRPRWRNDRDDPDGRPRGPAGRGGRWKLHGPARLPRLRLGPGVLARWPIPG